MLRPQRYRTLMGFIMGLCLSLIILGLVYIFFGSSAYKLSSKERAAIETMAVEAYTQKNPTGLVYVATTSLKSGEVLKDSDLMPAEISKFILPSDAISDPALAVGKIIRCDVTTYTAVTLSLLYDEGNYPDDMRLVEYTVINLPQKLEPSQFVDIRIMFPNGLDYIVLSKKHVTDLQKASESQKSTLWFHAVEEEILRMASAIVDASIVEGATLYAVPYVAPDIQNEAIRTYPSNAEVQNLILQNPNIVEKAVTMLEARNRSLFEDQINKDRQNFGMNKVYGEDASMPPNEKASSPSQAETKGLDLDGRL